MDRRAVVLMGGGLDCTLAPLARAEGFVPCPLILDDGHTPHAHLRAADRVAMALGLQDTALSTVDLAALDRSAPTLRGEDPRRTTRRYAPSRRLAYLSAALYWAEVVGAWDIYLGIHSEGDEEGLALSLALAFEQLANLIIRQPDDQHERTVKLHMPFLGMERADILRQGIAMGFDYAITRSCTDPNSEDEPCSCCQGCLDRAVAFREAGYADPLLAPPVRASVLRGKRAI